MIMENYIYPGALPHQIQFFSYGYEWDKNPTSESFAKDFIEAEYAHLKAEIPNSILRIVLETVQNTIPEDRFLSADHH